MKKRSKEKVQYHQEGEKRRRKKCKKCKQGKKLGAIVKEGRKEGRKEVKKGNVCVKTSKLSVNDLTP